MYDQRQPDAKMKRPQVTDPRQKSILFTTVLVSAALLIGRISGFIRETILAARFGVTADADIAILLLTLPDFLVGLLLSGGLSAALLPAMKKLPAAERVVFFQKSALFAFAIFAAFAAGLALWPDIPFRLLAPGLPAEAANTYAVHLAVSAVAIPFAAVSGVSVSYLNTQGKFFVAGLGTLVFNLVLCIYLLAFFNSSAALFGFAFAIVAAALARWGSQIAQMRHAFRAVVTEQPVRLRPVYRGFLNGLIAYSIIFGVPYLFRSVFGSAGEGNLAVFNFALKLFELPSVLLIAPLVTVMLPRLSSLAAEGGVEFRETLSAGLYAATSLAIIALAYGLVFGDAAAQVIFTRGEMQSEDVDRVAEIAKVMFVSLPFLAISQLTATALNAQAKTQLVLRNALIALVFVVVALLALPADISNALVIWVLVGFHAALAVLNLMSVVRVAELSISPLLWSVAKTSTPVVLLALIFWVTLNRYAPESGNLTIVALSVPCGVLMLMLNWRALKTLRRIRNV